ncbi:hypothetical protein JXR93_14070 [bacterium]|nr:hypothetical protein [bacterium]
MKKHVIMFLISVILLINPVFSQQNDVVFDDMNDELEVIQMADAFSKRDLEKASSHLRKALIYQPEKNSYYLYLSIMLTIGKKYDDAISFLNKVDNNDPYKYLYLIHSTIAKNGYNKDVRELLLKIKSIFESKTVQFDESHLLYYSVLSYFLKEKELSKQFFDEAIKKNRDILSARYYIEPARDIAYHVYMKLASDKDIYYYNSLATIKLRFMDINSAISELNQSLKLDKQNPTADKLLSDAYILKGDFESALKHLKLADKYFFNNEDIYANYYTIYKKRDAKERLELCRSLLNQNASSFFVTFCIAESYLELKEIPKAKYYADFLLQKDSDGMETNLLMGDLIYKEQELIGEKLEKGELTEEQVDRMEESLKDPMEFYFKALIKKPFDYEVISRIYRGLLDVELKNSDGSDKESFEDPELLNLESTEAAWYREALRDYEKSLAQKAKEESLVEYYSKFSKYLVDNDETAKRDLKYFKSFSTMEKYLTYLETKKDEDFQAFMTIFHKKYMDLAAKDHSFNEIKRSIPMEEGKEIEYTKFFPFVPADYFE